MVSLEYLAGLIDGEGNIGIYSAGSSGQKRLHVEISMTHYETVKCIHDQFGGQFREKKTAKGYKNQWHWRLTHKKAAELLRKVQPHLITKYALVSELLGP